MIRRAAVLVLVPAFVVTACISAPYPTPPSPSASATSLDAYYAQDLDWRSCGQQFECAQLAVPKDYQDTTVGDFELAILRLEASGNDRLGSLVINPGGPGGSGVDYAKAAQYVISDPVRKAYDIVGFDPRGVADSDPVECLTDTEMDEWLAFDGEPETTEEAQDLAEAAAAFGQACADASPGTYTYMDTDSVTRDLDVLRAALGDNKLNYMGKSYGTLIGEDYLRLFPERVGRMVLDGVLPPNLTSEQIGHDQAVSFEQELRRFVRYCQRRASCPLPEGSVDKGVARITKFLDSLQTKPIKAQPGRPLNEPLATGAILYYLYAPFYGDWDELSDGLADAFKGDGSTLLKLYDAKLERASDGTFLNNSGEAFYAVSCLDRGAEDDLAAYAARAREWAKDAPTFGPMLAWSDLVCAKWPVEPKGEVFTVNGAGAGPILVVSTTRDPATPLKWAQSVASQLRNARLVTWDADGHTAYMNGSKCVDNAVDAYLLHGTLPKTDLRCG